MILEETKNKLAELKNLMKLHPDKRSTYELQAKMLKAALSIYYKAHPNEQQPLTTKP